MSGDRSLKPLGQGRLEHGAARRRSCPGTPGGGVAVSRCRGVPVPLFSVTASRRERGDRGVPRWDRKDGLTWAPTG